MGFFDVEKMGSIMGNQGNQADLPQCGAAIYRKGHKLPLSMRTAEIRYRRAANAGVLR